MNNVICTIDIPAICGMGLHMQLDGFRLIYTAIATFMWIVSAIFSVEYMSHYKKKGRYYFFLALTYFATVGVFLSVDLYTTFVFFEVMSLASYVWVAQDEKPAAIKAGNTYLAVAVIGGLVMLMGIFLLYDLVGTLRFDSLLGLYGETGMLTALGYPEAERRLWAAGLCLLFGFGAKAGAFPLHIWLPKAHPVAPAPASALLSGILTKSGIYGVLILTSYIFFGSEMWGTLILLIGVCTMVLGAVLALLSIDLKRTLACSSVSQIGFILTGIGTASLLVNENGMALRGSFLHMVNHSLIKLVLFCAAGVVYMNLHSLDLNEIRGFGRKKPLLNGIFLMGALGIGGVPLWNGYISKTLIHESIVEYKELLHEGLAGTILSAGAIQAIEYLFLISGGFTVAYMTKLYICIFIEKNKDEARQEAFDNNKKYMNAASATVLTLSTIILPVLGMTSSISMNKLADMASGFLNARPVHPVNYFSFENLKGGLISIAIGVILYVIVTRVCLMDEAEDGKKVYINCLPAWLDLEDLIYKPILIYALPFISGVICRVLDSLVDWTVVLLRKTIYRDSPLWRELPEGNKVTHMLASIMNAFQRFANLTWNRKHQKSEDYEHKLAVSYETYAEDRFIIFRSMSFGLLLFCVGLVVTVLYMFIRKLMM